MIEEWERRIGRPLNEGYGLSETSPVTHSTPQLALRKLGTVGLPFPDTDMKIVDVETGTRELPLGETGELCIAGPAGDEGLLEPAGGDARTCCARDADGRIWFHTGDIARDGRGRLHVDRPAQEGHDHRRRLQRVSVGRGVGAVRASGGAAGGGHRRAGHAITARSCKACIALKPGASATTDEIVAHCREEPDATTRCRGIVEIRDTLPMSAVGKILYRVLRDEHAAGARSRMTPRRHCAARR